jgi:3-phenylpropionate/trans-cinnamate dioxygenase ferredoxin reductase component
VTLDHVVAVGVSSAGLTTAETLRREGFQGRLTLLGDEDLPPYDRPPLSKQVLSAVIGGLIPWYPNADRTRP